MNIIQVKEIGGSLVVDSRLIAAKLDIKHKNLIGTINKYKSEAEEEFGVIAFETEKPLKGTQGGRPSEWAYLSEDQSLYFMTLSKNTPKVRRCKRELVKAFSEAKKIIPAQQHEIEKLKLELELAKAQQENAMAQQKLLASVQCLEAISPGLAPLALGNPDSVVERVEIVEHHAAVDGKGKTIAETTGTSKTAIAKSLGMKKAKDLTTWLESIDRLDLLDTGMRIISCEYIPHESINEIRSLWALRQGNRQKLIGE
ncbi:MAG: Rha family transcriptional regulator [Cyanobacteria bacterium P01_F01_bin.150]